MKKKPVTPTWHGLIDYAFSGILMTIPRAVGLNPEATRTYLTLGGGFLAINALTNTPVAIKPVISFKDHQRLDAAFLVGLSLLSLTKRVRNDRKTAGFQLGFLGTAVAHYLLTDYPAGSQEVN